MVMKGVTVEDAAQKEGFQLNKWPETQVRYKINEMTDHCLTENQTFNLKMFQRKCCGCLTFLRQILKKAVFCQVL